MVTLVTPLTRQLMLVGLLLATFPACGRILGIEGAHVDPILDDNPTEVNQDDDTDDPDTVEVPEPDAAEHETKGDAGEHSNDTQDGEDDTTNECISFDNGRVRHLNSDGTLTPLPELPSAR